jgi:calcium-dependent protein kinase
MQTSMKLENFRKLVDIGKGSYSVVSLMQHNKTGKVFACKTIPKGNMLGEECKREVEVMKLMEDCRNIVQIEFSQEDDKNLYIMLEYCSGGSVRHYIDTHEKIQEPFIKKIVKQAVQAIYNCEKKGLIHMDVKPENLLFTSSACINVKLCDFGLTIQDGQSQHIIAGTPAYIAPETIEYKSTMKSDVWAIGIMTFHLFTGRFPFNPTNNLNAYSLFQSIIYDPVVINKNEIPNASNKAISFMIHVLNKSTDKRLSASEALKHPWLSDSFCCF